MSRRTLITGMALLMALLLAACGSDPVDAVYTAAGDASHPDELTRTSTFRPDDDLNLVVTLNAHNRTLPVHVTFTDPQGATVTTDTVEAAPPARWCWGWTSRRRGRRGRWVTGRRRSSWTATRWRRCASSCRRAKARVNCCAPSPGPFHVSVGKARRGLFVAVLRSSSASHAPAARAFVMPFGVKGYCSARNDRAYNGRQGTFSED